MPSMNVEVGSAVKLQDMHSFGSFEPFPFLQSDSTEPAETVYHLDEHHGAGHGRSVHSVESVDWLNVVISYSVTGHHGV